MRLDRIGHRADRAVGRPHAHESADQRAADQTAQHFGRLGDRTHGMNDAQHRGDNTDGGHAVGDILHGGDDGVILAVMDVQVPRPSRLRVHRVYPNPK